MLLRYLLLQIEELSLVGAGKLGGSGPQQMFGILARGIRQPQGRHQLLLNHQVLVQSDIWPSRNLVSRESVGIRNAPLQGGGNYDV